MVMKFMQPLKFENGGDVHAIVGFNNGSFSVLTSHGGEYSLLLYDENGILLYQVSNVKTSEKTVACGVDLGDGLMAIGELKTQGEMTLSGYVRQKQGQKIVFDNATFFANGWYDLLVKEEHWLFSAEHELMAQGHFGQVKVFDVGYAIESPQTKGEWSLFLANGYPLRKLRHCLAWVGDGNLLYREDKHSSVKMADFGGRIISTPAIHGFETFPNGCFVLNFDGGLKRMHYADGTKLSVAVKNALFVADGRFVQYDNFGLISGIYSANGVAVQRPVIYTVTLLGNYYLITDEFKRGILFDDGGAIIAEELLPMQVAGGFVLLKEISGAYVLFNQKRKVLTLVGP